MSDTITTENEPATPVEESVPERTEARIFRYSDWVNVGEGSADCPHAQDGKCREKTHFHAWVRLPNKFQIVQIREKAQAARARVLRQAKDPETDRWEIIENQVEEAFAAGKDGVVAELLGLNEWKRMRQGMAELVNDDQAEGDGEGEEVRSPWADIEADQERFRHLSSLPEEDRDEDEYGELSRHLTAWNEALDERLEELRAPERESLEERSEEELRAMVRENAVTDQANGIFMRTFARWQMAVCTMKVDSHTEKLFPSPQRMEAESPEVIAALELAFNDLESEFNNRLALRAEGN